MDDVKKRKKKILAAFERFVEKYPDIELRIERQDSSYRAVLAHAGTKALCWIDPTPKQESSTLMHAKGEKSSSPDEAVVALAKKLQSCALQMTNPNPPDPFMVSLVAIPIPDFGFA